MVEGMGLYLLVGPLVFFVDDDEPQVFQRRKQRAPRPDHHVVTAFSHVPPLVELLPRGHSTVQQGGPSGEPRIDTLQRLGGKGDFRHQEQGPFSVAHHTVDGPQVDFCLAAAGYTVQQEAPGLMGRVVQRELDVGQRRSLLRRQREACRPGAWHSERWPRLLFTPRFLVTEGVGPRAPPFHPHQPLFEQRLGGTGAKFLVGQPGRIRPVVGLQGREKSSLPAAQTGVSGRGVTEKQERLVPGSHWGGEGNGPQHHASFHETVHLPLARPAQSLQELPLWLGSPRGQCLKSRCDAGFQAEGVHVDFRGGLEAGTDLSFEPRRQEQG